MINSGRNLKVIFVDDDLAMLESTKRLFFDMDEWDMEFYESGAEVVKRIKEEFIDIVVSDMRMPEMNGAELLDIVKNLSPGTIRIILSGYSDKEMILKTVYSADQFIAKPCKPETLKKAITRTRMTIENVSPEAMKEIGKITRKIPTLPDIYIELEKRVKKDTCSMKDIACLIKKDIGITAKIFQVVNSAFFGHSVRINNIEMAVSHLGIETLQSILLAEKIFRTFSKKDISDFDIVEIYQHCFLVSMLSKKITSSLTDNDHLINISSIAGMLHDIGKLLLIKNKRDYYFSLFKQAKTENVPLIVKEKELLGFTHADIGSYLAKRWGLDEEIYHALLYHHNPHHAITKEKPVTMAVYMANLLSYYEYDKIDKSHDFDKGFLTKLDLFKYLPEWNDVSREMKEILARGEVL